MIGLLANWSAIAIILTMFPMSYLLINIGQALNGISGAALIAGPPLVAVTWFPPNERATATAVSVMAVGVGMAGSFVLGINPYGWWCSVIQFRMKFVIQHGNFLQFVWTNNRIGRSIFRLDRWTDWFTGKLEFYYCNMWNVSNQLSHTQKRLINTGHILNGIGSAATSAFPALLAVTWFPPQQRTTATAMSLTSLNFGIGISFILVCGLIGLHFLAVLLYFPSKPPTPPSKTASLGREKFGKALKSMRGNLQLWLIIVCCTLPSGVYGNWSSVLNVVLIPVGVSQRSYFLYQIKSNISCTDIGNLGAAVCAVGALASVIIARFSDMFMRHMKMILILLYIIGIGAFTWFIVLAKGIIEFKLEYISREKSKLYMLWQISNVRIINKNSNRKIRKITLNIMSIFNNSFFCYRGFRCIKDKDKIDQVNGNGTEWMNYSLVGSLILSLLILFMIKEKYSRTDIDIDVTDDKNNDKKSFINT
ncbi:hypothetical protein KUTeg_015504 [Tegillarca granosa]|uniref:Uncharacterized protein n=1 Tax=Tegillarca granosa TaxID=220873 RepID=A0ABQ9EUR6_TEGGR|nr:hypothetical protein KUTeg_015504 [Tegillarca granosa]